MNRHCFIYRDSYIKKGVRPQNTTRNMHRVSLQLEHNAIFIKITGLKKTSRFEVEYTFLEGINKKMLNKICITHCFSRQSSESRTAKPNTIVRANHTDIIYNREIKLPIHYPMIIIIPKMAATKKFNPTAIWNRLLISLLVMSHVKL